MAIHFHLNFKQYTRHQKNPKVLSRLDFILVSEGFLSNCIKSQISPGIQSDHSIVSLQFNDGQPVRGPGYWKLNCDFLQHDTDFINFIKDKITDFKHHHQNSECNPNVIWDALKCTIAGVCKEYSARKKKERKANKEKKLADIEKVKIEIANNKNADNILFSRLEELEKKLDNNL